MNMSVAEKLRVVNDYIDASELPIHVIPLANKLGLEVYRAEWPSSISGKIQREEELGGPSGYAIFVNSSHNERRRRFTIAHEIAHFVLHEELIGEGLYDDGLYRSGLSEPEEIDANKLAADILMPRRVLNEFAFAADDVETLAHQFNVSEQAMAVRLGIPAAW